MEENSKKEVKKDAKQPPIENGTIIATQNISINFGQGDFVLREGQEATIKRSFCDYLIENNMAKEK